MSEFYGRSHRSFQDEHGTRALADRLELLAHAEFDAADRAFIESAAMFFLATVDQQGMPTVSYKGGVPRFVRITAPGELIFPVYDGGHYPGAQHLVRVSVRQLFVNCGRYIHKVQAQTLSPHVPDPEGKQPFPEWKRIAVIAETLSEGDKGKVERAGGTIALEEYCGEDLAD